MSETERVLENSGRAKVVGEAIVLYEWKCRLSICANQSHRRMMLLS